MKRYNTLIGLGIIIALVPFLGIPRSWKYFFMVVAGIAVATVALLMRRRDLAAHKRLTQAEAPAYARTYVENEEAQV